MIFNCCSVQTTQNTAEETLQLLSYAPQRLGHATFLDAEAIALVLEKKMCIEICLSSNILYAAALIPSSHIFISRVIGRQV